MPAEMVAAAPVASPSEPDAPQRRLAGFGTEKTAKTSEPTYAVVPYYGVDVRVLDDGEVLMLDLEEFLDEASAIAQDDPSVVAVMRRLLRRIVHPDDFTMFWTQVRANRQNVEDQMAFAKYVIETMSGHPTPLPSGSSPGRQRTARKSGAAFSSKAQQRLEQQGRPDLAVVVVQSREARKRAEQTSG